MRRASRIGLLVTLLCVDTGSARAADTLETVEMNGPEENRIDLVITGDGYTAAQAELFRTHVASLIEGLFASLPWSSYRRAFNLYRVVTESNESGADHPSQSLFVDTYFDGEFEYLGIDRLVTANEAKVTTVVTGLLPEADLIVLILNDSQYGGAGGSLPMVSANEYSIDILKHELGHTFAGLADEYTDPYPGYPAGDPEPNVDFDYTLTDIKWQVWIETGTPLPTTLQDAVDDSHPVGAYEGARYVDTGIYRPAPHCMMQSLEYLFCQVCTEALIWGLYARVDPIDSVTPAPGSVAVQFAQTFEVERLPVEAPGGPLTVEWLLDGETVGQEASVVLAPGTVPPGDHELVCRVADTTGLARRDPDGLLVSERRWTVAVVSGPDAGPDAGVSGDAGVDPRDPGGCGCASSRRGPGVLVWLLLLCFFSRRWSRTRRTAW